MKRLALILTLALLTAGCSTGRFADGYQFGDITGTALDHGQHLLELRKKHCTTTDPVLRQALLIAIRRLVPGYPAGGVCSDIFSLLEQPHAVP